MRSGISQVTGCNLIDVEHRRKGTILVPAALGLALASIITTTARAALPAQTPPPPKTPVAGSPPPSTGGFFPLSQVRRGMIGTAWTVFSGTRPQPMGVKILGVLRNARGPHQDLILARLLGAEAQYTGVVEGMSGSPVYIGNKLVGALSYRIGQFSKQPIAGITPIEQMMQVRHLSAAPAGLAARANSASTAATFKPMETPLVMAGFAPAAVDFWEQKMAGTSLAQVAAGGVGGASLGSMKPSPAAEATMVPGSAVSALLVSGDLEVSATCTVTYLVANHLLACGHPLMQVGPVSMPMTTADVLTTLASPLNAFKIINTGATVGAFTQDRDSAIGGMIGAEAHMIPVHITVHDSTGIRHVNVHILDAPSLTPQAFEVVVYDALLQNNDSTAKTSYHLTGDIDVAGYPPSPLDLWSSAGGPMPASMDMALQTGQRFNQIYSNSARQGIVRSVNLYIDAIPRFASLQLQGAQLISSDIVHPGSTVVIDATIRPWQKPERNIRIPIVLPVRLETGTVRVLVSDAATLDRTLNQPRPPIPPPSLATVLAQDRRLHPPNRIYVSLLLPEAQASINGETLTDLPLSVANAFEPVRTSDQIVMNGESVKIMAQEPVGGVLSGFQILTLHIEADGSLN